MLTFLGAIIKSFNGADMLNYFDKEKYDKDKTSKLVGLDFLITGLSILFLAFISFFINEIYYNLICNNRFIYTFYRMYYSFLPSVFYM